MDKRFSNAYAVVVLAAGVSACASSPPVARPAGTLPPGTAQVRINDQDLPQTHAVQCMQMGSLTRITIGDPAAETSAFVASGIALSAKSVAINHLGGFTGNYAQGLEGSAEVMLNDSTYIIRGSATGFEADGPDLRTTGKFLIQVAC